MEVYMWCVSIFSYQIFFSVRTMYALYCTVVLPQMKKNNDTGGWRRRSGLSGTLDGVTHAQQTHILYGMYSCVNTYRVQYGTEIHLQGCITASFLPKHIAYGQYRIVPARPAF